MPFDHVKRKLRAAVLVKDALVVARARAAEPPRALVGHAAVGKLPDINTAHVGGVHVVGKRLVKDLGLSLLAPSDV